MLVSKTSVYSVKPGWRGEALSELSRLWTERAKIAASLIEPGSRILDLGCGEGLLRQFLPQGCTWKGYDLRPLRPEVGLLDLDNGGYPDGHFDYVMMLGVLTWLSNPIAVLQRALSSAPFLIASDRRRRWRWKQPLRLPTRSDELDRMVAVTQWQIDRKIEWCRDPEQELYVCRLRHSGAYDGEISNGNTKPN